MMMVLRALVLGAALLAGSAHRKDVTVGLDVKEEDHHTGAAGARWPHEGRFVPKSDPKPKLEGPEPEAPRPAWLQVGGSAPKHKRKWKPADPNPPELAAGHVVPMSNPKPKPKTKTKPAGPKPPEPAAGSGASKLNPKPKPALLLAERSLWHAAERRNAEGQLLNKEGWFTEIISAGDGNCLFRSFARAAWPGRDEENKVLAQQLRARIVEYIRKHQDNDEIAFAIWADHFLQVELEEFFERRSFFIDQYSKKMLQDGEWGGPPELLAASFVLNRPVQVWIPVPGPDGEAQPGELQFNNRIPDDVFDGEEQPGEVVHVFHVNGNHYNFLQPVPKDLESQAQKDEQD